MQTQIPVHELARKFHDPPFHEYRQSPQIGEAVVVLVVDVVEVVDVVVLVVDVVVVLVVVDVVVLVLVVDVVLDVVVVVQVADAVTVNDAGQLLQHVFVLSSVNVPPVSGLKSKSSRSRCAVRSALAMKRSFR